MVFHTMLLMLLVAFCGLFKLRMRYDRLLSWGISFAFAALFYHYWQLSLYDMEGFSFLWRPSQMGNITVDFHPSEAANKQIIPIFFISARNTDDDKIIALNIGGDDYIEKPYSLGVLLAKVKVILKRFKKDTLTEYNDNHLRVDYKNKEVYVDNNQVKLTSLEYKLLTYLIANSNRLVTKEELFDNVWQDKWTTDGTLNVHIRKIREAIEIDPNNPKYIVTVWKEGYKFEGESE